MTMDRRSLLKVAGLAPLASPRFAFAQNTPASQKADYTLHIANGQVELAPGKVVSTTLYNGQYPGRTLFHCHMQLHMDFGFMALFNYI